MKNLMKLVAATAVALSISACAKNPVVYDNSRTNINDVRTSVISGDDLRARRESGIDTWMYQ